MLFQVGKGFGIKSITGRPCENKDDAWEEFKTGRQMQVCHRDGLFSCLGPDRQNHQL